MADKIRNHNIRNVADESTQNNEKWGVYVPLVDTCLSVTAVYDTKMHISNPKPNPLETRLTSGEH